MNITNHTESPYFERLPRYALAALQAAWDKAHGKQFGTIAIYQSFCRDMDQIGWDKPSRPLMSDWVARVQQGLVVRPGSPADGADPALVATLEDALDAPIEDIVEPPVDLDAEAATFVQPEPAVEITSAPADPSTSNEVLRLFAEPAPTPSPVEDVLREVRDSLRKELRISCADGLDDLTDAVVTRAQKLARDMMIEILRDLAAEMEAAA